MTFQKVIKMTEITVPLHTIISSTVCTLNMSIKSSRAPSSQLLNGFKGNKKTYKTGQYSTGHAIHGSKFESGTECCFDLLVLSPEFTDYRVAQNFCGFSNDPRKISSRK